MLTPSTERIRLDKWLWAARFYKTRALAKEAIEGGKVKLNGQRAKPAHAVKINDELHITIGEYSWTIYVLQLSERRSSASIAQTRYREDERSKSKRHTQIEQRKQLGNQPAHKAPDKRDRREMSRLKRQETLIPTRL